MTDDFGFDPADTELARRLGSAAPQAGDADAVLAGLRPRLTRARRRRQAGFVAIGVAMVVVLAGAAFAAVDPGGGSKVRVPPAHRSPATVDTVPSPTTPTVPTTTGTVTAPSPSPSTASGTTGTTTPAPPPTTVDDHGGNRGPGGSDDSGSNSGPGSGSSGSGSSGSGSGSSGTSGKG